LNPQELFDKIKESSTYKEWLTKHEDSFLSHLFCQINSNLEEKGKWELGFYSKKNDKISTFLEDFSIKKDDEVFKKPGDQVEELQLDKLSISFDDAKKVFKEKFPELFPSEQLGDGFVVLQTLKDVTLWNFTLVSKSIKFLNMKINASTGKVEAHQAVELIKK